MINIMHQTASETWSLAGTAPATIQVLSNSRLFIDVGPNTPAASEPGGFLAVPERDGGMLNVTIAGSIWVKSASGPATYAMRGW